MKARLFTLCGCTKEVETTYPPPREIFLPLWKKVKYGPINDIAQENAALLEPRAVRRFKMTEFVNYGPLHSMADYLEESSQ